MQIGRETQIFLHALGKLPRPGRARAYGVALLSLLSWIGVLAAAAAEGPPSGAGPRVPPKIISLLKPSIYKKVMEDRGPEIYARLEDGKRYKLYKLYAVMQVGASQRVTRQVLTDYKLYAQLIPYVQKAEYSEKEQLLHIEGGIWKYQLESTLKFEVRTPDWIAFRIVEGHFRGLQGEILFEPSGERGTLVYLRGELEGQLWPPQWIIERGAEVVFGFTAGKMRSTIEDKGKRNGNEASR